MCVTIMYMYSVEQALLYCCLPLRSVNFQTCIDHGKKKMLFSNYVCFCVCSHCRSVGNSPWNLQVFI